jgi:TRAP transporter TAXI family solute receptor
MKEKRRKEGKVMKWKLKLKIVLILAIVCMLCLFPNNKANAVTHIRIASSAIGGTWFPISAGVSGIINSKLEGVMAAPTLGGGIANVKSLQKGDIEMGITMASTAYEAWNGYNWAEGKQYRDFRVLFNMYISGFQFVVQKKSKIFTFKDLLGKRYCPGKVGWTAEVLSQEILKYYGFTYDDIMKKGGKIVYGGFGEMSMLMKDRHVDCVSATSPAPTSWIIDISTAFSIRLIPFPEDLLKYCTKKFGTSQYTVKAGAYKGVDKDVECLGVANIMLIHKKIPEELGYKITKVVWDNMESLQKIHPTVKKEMKLSKAVSGFSVPVHKGAAKYYLEKGLTIPSAAKPID